LLTLRNSYCIAFVLYFIVGWVLAAYTYVKRQIRLPAMLAFAFLAAFEACMASTELESGSAAWGYPVILGVGLGLCLPAIVTAAQLATPPELM
jgi:hypothetical protein